MLKTIPKVALVIDAIEEVDRGIVHGILEYSKLRRPWWISHFPPQCEELKRADFAQWWGHGIIAHMKTDEVCNLILQKNVPTIAIGLSENQLQPSHPASQLPEIRGNSKRIGVMAAEFFLERQFLNYAYVGNLQNDIWSVHRQNTYLARLRQEGFSCDIFSPTVQARQNQKVYQKQLAKWLQKLSKPVAVFAADDAHASLVFDACRNLAMNIPDEISLLGVDNDEMRCEMLEPSLTSIARNHRETGFMAAEYLDQMMQHKVSGRKVFYIEPTRIVIRHSTASSIVTDPLVAKAISFIHSHSGVNISVLDVVRHVGLQRRNLEKRFRLALNRSIHNEIDRVRITRIQQLLVETDMTIREIADSCFFSSEMYLSNMFRKKTGLTMNVYRMQHRDLNYTRHRQYSNE